MTASSTPRLVTIGCSRGGLDALSVILRGLPLDFPSALVIVQHRAAVGSDGLRGYLQATSHLPVVEADDKDPVEPGRVVLAPADYHLLVEDGHFALSVDAPVWSARPAIDVLLESAADAYGERHCAVILTGASRDGAAGARRTKQRGGHLVVQDPATAEAEVMPRAALAAAPADRVLSVPEIAPYLRALCAASTLSAGGVAIR